MPCTVAAFLYLQRAGYLTPENILSYLRLYPTLAPALFVLIYALMVTFLLPTLPLNLAAGFLWGSLFGCALSIAAATLGASWSFLLARYLGRDFLEERFTNRAWRWLRHEIDKQDWKAVAFTRTINLLHGGNYTDAMVMYRAYKKQIIYDLALLEESGYAMAERLFRTRISWEPLLSVRAAKKKLKVAEIPGDEPPRIGGERKLKILKWGAAYYFQFIREVFFWKCN